MYKYRTFSIVYNIFSFPVCQRTYIVILETKVPPRRPRPRAERKDKMYGFCLDNQIDYDRHLFKLK